MRRLMMGVGLCGVVFLSAGAALTTQRRAADPIEDTLRPLVTVLQHEEELGLAKEKREEIEGRMQKAVANLPEQKAVLQGELDSLAELLSVDQPDEAKALAQLDKVLEAERVIKRARLSLALEIKGQLTHEEQVKLRAMRQKAGAVPTGFLAQMQQASEGLRHAKAQGKDVTEAAQMLLKVQSLQEQGQFKEAEEELDRVLKTLR